MQKLVSICLLFICHNCQSQGWAEPFNLPMPNAPLIVIDGRYRANDFTLVNPKEILKVETLGNAASAAIYGRKGSNGAILITTIKQSTAGMKLQPLSEYSSKHKYNSIVVLNNAKSDRGLIGLSTDDILDFQFKTDTNRLSTNTSRYSLKLAIITFRYAVTQYQQKFGTFSENYKTYLKAHNNNDKDFLYVINNNLIKTNTVGDFVKALYQIPLEGITAVRFIYEPAYDSGMSRPGVFITTKKP